jgi:hypothetical protein
LQLDRSDEPRRISCGDWFADGRSPKETVMKYALLPSIAALGLLTSPLVAASSAPTAQVKIKVQKTADSRDIGHKKGDRGGGISFADSRDIGHKKGDRGGGISLADSRDIGHKKGDRGGGISLADSRDIGHKKGDRGGGISLADSRDIGHKKGDRGGGVSFV